MSVTKKELKLLRIVGRRPRSRAFLLRKFTPDQISRLNSLSFIRTDYERPRDENGFPVGDYPGSAVYYLTYPAGVAEKESHDWFDAQYFIANILVPLLIGFFSGIGTYIISTLLF